MNKDIYLLKSAAVLLVFCLWSVSVLSEESDPWKFLPTRILEIDGGSVAFQSAVIIDTRQQLANILFQDYPTKYILRTKNESDFPVWVDVEWRVPGDKPFASFGKLDPNSAAGEFFVKIKAVVWNTPIPVAVAIYADKNKRQRLGGRQVVLLFAGDEEEKSLFLESAKKINTNAEKTAIAHGKKAWMPLISGFQEMIDISNPVSGSVADSKLTEDIKLLLWKNQSHLFWDCAHEVLSARQYDPVETGKFQNLSQENKQIIEESRAQSDIVFEEWRIRSCDSISNYLVLIGKSPKGGTDLKVVKIQTGT